MYATKVLFPIAATLIIMATATVSHRRKGATYGKAYRKPFSHSSFVHDNLPLHSFDNVLEGQAKNSSPQYEQAPLKRQPSSEAPNPSIAAVFKSKPDHGLLSPRGQPAGATPRADNADLYNFTSSDEEVAGHSASVDALNGKRRKMNPRSARDDMHPVFDDYSLQRHIATEVDRQTNGKTKNFPENGSRPQPRARVRPMVHPAERRPEPSAEKSTLNSKTTVGRNREKGVSGKIAFHKGNGNGNVQPVLMHPPETSANSRLDTSTPHLEAQKKAFGLEEPEDRAPKTPPRKIRPASATTTPRQRELWGRLLIDGGRSMSPSKIDLPPLQVTESRCDAVYQQFSQPSRPQDDAEDAEAKFRPKRIIDILHPSVDDDSPVMTESESNQVDESSISSIDDQSLSEESENSLSNDLLTLNTSYKDPQITYKPPVGATPSATQATNTFQPGGLRVTYAQQRSYLSDHTMGEAAISTMSPVNKNKAPKLIRRHELGMPASQSKALDEFDLDEEENSQGGAMRSIHELREAGGNARLVGEIETSLDELDRAQVLSASARRSALVDLVTKLQEESNCRLVVDKGLEPRLLKYVGFDSDLITNSLFAAAILRLMANSTSPDLMSQIESITLKSFLIQLLDLKQDLSQRVKGREFNMSRHAQKRYIALCANLLKSSVWRAGRPHLLSCHALALQCLEYLVRRTGEIGSGANILSVNQIQHLIEAAIPSFRMLPDPGEMAMLSLELALSILESATVGSLQGLQDPWPDKVSELVRDVLPGLYSRSKEGSEALQILTLRLYLNVTNNMPFLCEAFARPHVIDTILDIVLAHFQGPQGGSQKQQGLRLDKAILSLGCLINLAESSDTMRNSSILGRHGKSSLLDTLLELFLKKRREVAEVSLTAALKYVSLILAGRVRRRERI